MICLRRSPLLSSTIFAVLLGIVCVLWVDRPLADLLKQTIHGLPEDFFKLVTNLGRAELYMVPSGLIAAVSLFWGQKTLNRPAAYVFLSMLAAGAVELLTKFVVGRPRPKLWLEQGIFTLHPFSHGWEINSFPSGHSQAAWTAMVALGIVFPRYRWVFIGIATLVAISRVMLTVHWASDALAGAWLGFAVAMLLRPVLARADKG